MYRISTGAESAFCVPGWDALPGLGNRFLQTLAITPDDVLWYSDYARGYLGRFDPQTEKFQTWAIPSGGGVVRNMMHTPDGKNLWLATSGVNGIARVEIKND